MNGVEETITTAIAVIVAAFQDVAAEFLAPPLLYVTAVLVVGAVLAMVAGLIHRRG